MNNGFYEGLCLDRDIASKVTEVENGGPQGAPYFAFDPNQMTLSQKIPGDIASTDMYDIVKSIPGFCVFSVSEPL